LLAQLHDALAALPSLYDLPPGPDGPPGRQLIHGDFNASNVLWTEHAQVVIDFEDACYATCEYEVGNTIYMTFFDYRHHPGQFRDTQFVSGFLAGYTALRDLDKPMVRMAVDQRVARLASWLTHPSQAPLVIKTSSAAWKQELNHFVLSYQSGQYEALGASIA